jgi:hypothetical protein
MSYYCHFTCHDVKCNSIRSTRSKKILFAQINPVLLSFRNLFITFQVTFQSFSKYIAAEFNRHPRSKLNTRSLQLHVKILFLIMNTANL